MRGLFGLFLRESSLTGASETSLGIPTLPLLTHKNEDREHEGLLHLPPFESFYTMKLPHIERNLFALGNFMQTLVTEHTQVIIFK